MTTGSFVVRNYCSADLDRFTQFLTNAESVCRSRDEFFLISLSGELLTPINFSAEDLWLAEERGRIIGSCRVVPELAIDRAVLRLYCARNSLNEETITRLLSAAIDRVCDLKAGKVHADLRESDRCTRSLFEKHGFKPVREYTDMVADLDSMPIIEPDNKGLAYRALEPGREEELTQLQNRVFAGSWGFCPNTTNEIVGQLNAPGYGHDGAILAYLGEKAAGYCWTVTAKSATDLNSREPVGRIHMMGLVPEFRGRGLGKYILRSGLKHLSSKSVRTVELTVDNENATAYTLYRNAGFEPKTALVWYEKRTH